MGRGALWLTALLGSAALHGLAAVLLVPAYAPEKTPRQHRPESALRMETADVPRDTAEATRPETDAANEAQADAVAVAPGMVRQTRAAPLAVIAEAGHASGPSGERVAAESAGGARLRANAPAPKRLDPASAVPDRISAALPNTQPLAAATVTSAEELTAASATAEAIAPAAPPAESLGEAQAPSTDLVSVLPVGARVSEPPLPAASGTAATAFAFADRVVTDPTAISTIQAFIAPEALDDADAVKDGLASVLTGVDCARLSATYLPESGALELRGHIPDPALRGPLIAAFREKVGDGLPVTANLLHLPAPQCGALTGIADAGLPQSVDQFTDARLVGERAHARAYEYTEGQRLQFDLAAPEYDAVIYVDYFNAEGDVIHLVPNETIPLERIAANATLGVGQDRPGKPGLRLTIGPPYGQEIAVAFAASVPLYDGLRPIVEPAAPYLAFLKERIAEARDREPDFKGEWVYFFITTRPVTQ